MMHAGESKPSGWKGRDPTLVKPAEEFNKDEPHGVHKRTEDTDRKIEQMTDNEHHQKEDESRHKVPP